MHDTGFTASFTIDEYNSLLAELAEATETNLIQFKKLHGMCVIATKTIDNTKYLLNDHVPLIKALAASIENILVDMSDDDMDVLNRHTQAFHSTMIKFWRTYNLEPYCFYGVLTMDNQGVPCYFIASLEHEAWDKTLDEWNDIIRDKPQLYRWVGRSADAPFYADAPTLLHNYAEVIAEILVGIVDFVKAEDIVSNKTVD